MRDSLSKVVDYNRQFVGGGRDPQWLRAKLDRLCASPFGFLRGTFHLFAADWPELGDDPLAPGAALPIVGDLHLENLGAFKAHDGRFVFDVNDFDETGVGTPALDLGRLAVSFVLAGKREVGRAAARIESMLEAWRKAAAQLDLRPIEKDSKGLPAAIREVIARAEEGSRSEWIDARVEGDAQNRHFKSSEKYFPIEDALRRKEVEEALTLFARNSTERPAECPSWPLVKDVAIRIAGTGSLGRWRYAVLLPGKGEKRGKELILELKEALPSSLSPEDPRQAERVVAAQRRLQGDHPAYLGVTRVAGREFTVRELQPMEAKLDSSKLHGSDLDELAVAAGTVLGRLHRRGGELVERFTGRELSLARRIAAFALRYADVVESDWERLVKERNAVERALT